MNNGELLKFYIDKEESEFQKALKDFGEKTKQLARSEAGMEFLRTMLSGLSVKT